MTTPNRSSDELRRASHVPEDNAALERQATITWQDRMSDSVTLPSECARPETSCARIYTECSKCSRIDSRCTRVDTRASRKSADLTGALSRIDTESSKLDFDYPNAGSSDEESLAARPSKLLPASSAWSTYFMQEVACDRYLEFQLFLMSLATGCLDAMTVTTYGVFTSKLTGNTLWLALYSFRSPDLAPELLQNVGISVNVFIVGAIFFGQLGHMSRQRRRIWLLISSVFQAALICAAVAIRYFVLGARRGYGGEATVVLALLAFAESGQIATALNVNMPDVNTTMITGALIQLCCDREFFQLRNRKRDRRILFFLSLMAGGFMGASLNKYSNPSVAMFVVAMIKLFLIFTFFFNRGIVERNIVEDGTQKVSGTATPIKRVLWGD